MTAPISGRIGRALVTEGALVGQGEATQLAVIQQINPMYVNFTQSATEVLKLRRALEAGQLKRAAAPRRASVRVVLEDGTEYPQPGKLLFSDLTVDPTTGQVTLRAEVPNPNGTLLPGMYVRVRLEQAKASNAIAAAAAGRHAHASRATRVMVVGADGKVSAAHREDRRRAGRPVGGARRPEGRRAGDGRRLPEAADDAAGHAGEGRALAAAGACRQRRACRAGPRCRQRRQAADRSSTRMAKFFIDRPIFAWVIALFIIVLGARGDHAAADRAVPAGGAARHRGHRRLPRRLGPDAGGQRASA